MESEAITAFLTHVESLDLLPCYWPNIKGDNKGNKDTPTEPHFRVSVTPVSPTPLTLCGGEQSLWLLQISVYVRDDVGEIVPSEYADTLKAGVPFNTELQSGGYTFRTKTRGEVKPLIASSMDGWVFKPVQFRFESINLDNTMSFETFAGSHLSFAAALPSTYDQAGYEALTWTQDDCSSEDIPPLSDTANAVEISTVCNTRSRDIKGKSKFDPVAFTMLSDWDNTAQGILETAKDSQSAVISVLITFASGNKVYFTAQVGKFTLTEGGTGDDLNKRAVELWVQSDAFTKVAAA